MLSIIVAVAQNGAIGKDSQLIWHISDDLKRFKKLTTGHAILMGRKTFESLPNGALPNRENIVLTGDRHLSLHGCTMIHSIEEAVEKYAKSDEEVFVIGGGMVYNALLPFVGKLYLTRIHESFDADTYFPEIDYAEWEVLSDEHHEKGGNNQFDFSFVDLQRV